jgi:hypothetical protein
MERKHYILYRNPLIAILVSVTFIFASALPIFLETNQVQSAQTIFFDLPSKLAVNQSTDPTIRDSLKELFIEANLFLTKNATFVTEKTELPASGNIHDFLSLAPYCWPDPTKSNGLSYIYVRLHAVENILNSYCGYENCKHSCDDHRFTFAV